MRLPSSASLESPTRRSFPPLPIGPSSAGASPARHGEKGLATEAAIAARDSALHRLALASLISIVHSENTRSQGVARKLGMSIESQIYNPVLDCDVDVWQL